MAEAPATTPAESFATLLGQKGVNNSCKYYKRKLIGTGSYGEAWLVERVADQAIFVAKVMNLDKMSSRDKQYAYSEIKCLANCEHPNIVKYEEDHEENELLLIVMEYADAGDLDRHIKSRAADTRRFQEHEALFLFLQVCMALDHIHSHKMLHRDIKGANILLTSSGLVKLGDFGFSHQYDETVSGVVANTFCGTPYYLAPELWNNQRYSKKADVWSVGVLLYEIMALKRPFTASNMKGLMAKVLTGEYAPLPDTYTQAFRDVVRSILVVDANARPSISDIFRIPFVRQGLRSFQESLSRNTRVSEACRKMFDDHITAIMSDARSSSVVAKPSAPVGVINKEITFEGAIKKLGGVNGKTWKERYLLLQRGHLIICDKKGEEGEGKALSLEQVQSVCPIPVSTAKADFVFALNTTGGKSMWLQASTHDEMEQWIHAIQSALGIA